MADASLALILGQGEDFGSVDVDVDVDVDGVCGVDAAEVESSCRRIMKVHTVVL